MQEGLQVGTLNEEPGILSHIISQGDILSTLDGDRQFESRFDDREEDRDYQSFSNEVEKEMEQHSYYPYEHQHSYDPLDYIQNKVTSKIYREAYIGRSKKLSNLKSLSLLRKNRAADLQYFLKQTVKQTNRKGGEQHVQFEGKPILSCKRNLSNFSRQRATSLSRAERAAAAEITGSQNQTLSNRSAVPNELALDAQMTITTYQGGGKARSRLEMNRQDIKKSTQFVISNTSASPYERRQSIQQYDRDMPHSQMKHKNVLRAKVDVLPVRKNSDLADIHVPLMAYANKRNRIGSGFINDRRNDRRSGSKQRHPSGKSRDNITVSLDKDTLLEDLRHAGV